jgi:putative flippase GtrA
MLRAKHAMTTVTTKLTEMLNDKGRLHLQFIKYLFCGGITFVVDVAVFYVMAWLVLPSLRMDDPFGIVIGWFGWSIHGVSEQVLLRNFVVNKVVAFLASNTVAYMTNAIFVFTGGRHQRLKEVGLFYLLSTFSFVVFTWLSRVLIGRFGWGVSLSYFFVFALAMVTNFTMRKRLVFKG